MSQVVEVRHLLAGDLLFEQRAQNDGRGAGVFELPDAVEVVGSGDAARHQRMRQLHPEIIVLRSIASSPTLGLPRPTSSPPYSGCGTVMPASCW